MATIAEAFSLAVNYVEAGRSSDAEQICRQILAVDAACGDAWHLLGVIALQRGEPAKAADSLSRAVTANPADSEALNNFGIALQSLGKWDEAIERFRAAVAIRADFAEAQYNLANALHECGRIDEAIDGYRRALEFRPTDAIIYNNLANALRDDGKVAEAIAAYEGAIGLQPTYAEAYYNLGTLYQKKRLFERAIACYRSAIQFNPGHAEAYSNLGTLFQKQEKLDAAIACYDRAFELKPQSATVHCNLGLGLQEKGDLGKAIEHYHRAVALKPDYAQAYSSLGSATYDRGLPDEAIELCRHALRLQPDLVDAHCNLAVALLQRGDFLLGWSEFEWRWKAGLLIPRDFTQPRWNGDRLDTRTILLHSEQGFGDTLQFIRYASLVKSLGGTVVVECPERLMKLLKCCPDVDHLVRSGDQLPHFDLYAPLMSLPEVFKTSLQTIPRNVPYLFALPALIEQWRERLREVRGIRIGVNWHGRVGQGKFLQRDIPLGQLAGLATMPGVRLISLQKGAGQKDLATNYAYAGILDLGDQLDQENGPFMDTAAILMNLDLLITSDTSIAHLAGALGVPVWLALPFAADWRWLLDRADSPWYPTMRLFRQKNTGDWTSVFAEIKAALADKLQGST